MSKRFEYVKVSDRDIRSGGYYVSTYYDDEQYGRVELVTMWIDKHLKQTDIWHVRRPISLAEFSYCLELLQTEWKLGWREPPPEPLVWLDNDSRVEGHFCVRDATILSREGDQVTIKSGEATYVVNSNTIFTSFSDMRKN